MESKIKIRVSKELESLLDSDAESFELYRVVKGKKALNRNELLNSIVLHYCEDYQKKEEAMLRLVKAELPLGQDEAAQRIVYSFFKNEESKKTSYPCTLSFVPQQAVIPMLSYVESEFLKGRTWSEFLRSLFFSYASLPQDKREWIVFRDVYEEIEKAIENHHQVGLGRGKGMHVHVVSPYRIVSSKEELHNYVLFLDDSGYHTYRLNRIRFAIPSSLSCSFAQEDEEVFARAIRYGPQYYYEKEGKEISVKLTEKGKRLYESFYVHRPQYDEIKGDVYVFRCSSTHVLSYFSRFGKEAIVISPLEEEKEMKKFYQEGLSAYEADLLEKKKARDQERYRQRLEKKRKASPK